MGLAERQRELLVCQLVADAINVGEGTDYHAVACEPDPPDALLVSDSGAYATRQAEVVSTPQDFTIRYDNKNTRRFEHALQLALLQLGVAQCQVTVNWSDSARRHGAEDRCIEQLAEIIASVVPYDGYRCLRGVELYDYSPRISEIVNYASMFRSSAIRLSVHSACSWWAPRDGQWIEEAINKKVRKYGSWVANGSVILVIDGLAHLDGEQMAAFRTSYKSEDIPFAEVWAVTMGKAYRLKP